MATARGVGWPSVRLGRANLAPSARGWLELLPDSVDRETSPIGQKNQ